MEFSAAQATLALAFGMGLLHALDADHIMAVSGLASGRTDLNNCWRFCRRWALGHGAALGLIAIAVYGFSVAIPTSLSLYAESLVGLVLVLLGFWTLLTLLRGKYRFGFHRHPPGIHHGHWYRLSAPSQQSQPAQHCQYQQQTPAGVGQTTPAHNHSAVLVGLLHGTAGSAPLLVLIPLSRFESVGFALGYVLLFSFGVVLAMLLFGGLMGKFYQSLARFGDRAVMGLRSLIAISAIGFGGHLLVGYL
ncbi:MAG: hypothetical protein V7707_11100 [Motiliproteus sp.]